MGWRRGGAVVVCCFLRAGDVGIARAVGCSASAAAFEADGFYG